MATIVAKPKKKSTQRRAKFAFTSSEPHSSFECKLDKAKRFTPCRSPFQKTLAFGQHTFAVRAVDAAGNADGTPATWSFRIKQSAKKRAR